MKIHRFFRDFDQSKNIISIDDRAFVNQIRNVLRMKEGDVIELFNSEGNIVRAEILEMKKSQKGVSFRIREEIHGEEKKRDKRVNITLYMSVLKRENFEFVVQKTTEVGITEIVPIISERTVKLRVSLLRLQKIATEAAEQCGREIIPMINAPRLFNEVIKKTCADDTNIMFDKNGELYKESLTPGAKKRINLFVGPEGGWDNSEISIAKASGFAIVSLGKFTLRAETAGIIAAYLFSNS